MAQVIHFPQKIEKSDASSSEFGPDAGDVQAVGGMHEPDTLPSSRGRASTPPTPTAAQTIMQALRRDVFYVKVPKTVRQKERAEARSDLRKAVSWTWRTRRVMAPVYVAGAEFVALGAGPFELYGPLTGAAAVAWWRHNWRRSGVRVDISAVQGPMERARAWKRARRFVKNWTWTCRELGIDGIKITRMYFDEWSVSVDLRTTVKHGIHELRGMKPALERALDARRDSARILEVPGDPSARSIRIRVMRRDPHAVSVAPPAFLDLRADKPLLPVGLFETGDEVLLDLRYHLMVAGQSGSGKSALIQVVMRALTRTPWVSVVGIDMGPGATELGPWSDKVEVVGESVEDADVILSAVIEELERRGRVMAERGWKTWRSTPEEPFIAIVVDECQVLTQHGFESKVITLATLLRKYGGCLIMATQYPTKAAIPSSVKQQLQQTIGLRVKDEVACKVMFGDSAVKSGWTAHRLTDYRFFIESPRYSEPCMAKGFHLDEKAVDAAIESAPPAVRIRRSSCDLRTLLNRPAVQGVAAAEVTSIKVDRKGENRQRVLEALRDEDTHRREIEKSTGLNQTTVDRHLADLVEMGLAEKVAGGVYRRVG